MTRRIYFFDTTLRDGEQAPGFSMNSDEKLQIAHQLARLGVDVIEAGFPASSPGDFASVSAIAQSVSGPTIAGLARCVKPDIAKAAEALRYAAKPRIHTFIATSPIHMVKKLRMEPAQVILQVREMVTYARSFGIEVEFSAEDATRSDWPFLAQVFTVAAEAGASILNVPDTVGYTSPKEMYDLFRYLGDHVTAPSPFIFSCHNHDDLGLATANTLAAIEAGVTQVEGTINGIGERAGNVAIEEVVMALRTRADKYNVTTSIAAKEIYRTSRLLSTITGVKVQPNKAIVGANAFAHEAGIHQDGYLKDRQTYEIMLPADVGVPENALVLGKHSGRHAFRIRLETLGFGLTDAEVDRSFSRFKALADQKKAITDFDLEAIVGEELQHTVIEPFTLTSYQVFASSGAVATASVQIDCATGESIHEAASAGGPVEALYRAVDRATNFTGHLVDYQLQAVTDGPDAIGAVVVKIQSGTKQATGRGVATDVLEASVRAYVAAVNKINSGRGIEQPILELAEVSHGA